MKKILFILVFTIVTSTINSQTNVSSSFDLTIGYAEDGIGIQGAYNYHLRNSDYAQLSVFTAIARENVSGFEVPYTILAIQTGYYFNIWEERRFAKHRINIGGGFIGGYEAINNGSRQLSNLAMIDARSKFLFGVFAAVEATYDITRKWSILFKAQENFHINSEIGLSYPYLGAGIRYFLF